MKALDRKLLRDLFRLKGQVVTIAFVVAAGVAAFVTYRSAWVSLAESQATYYDRFRFAEVFAQLERAPRSVKKRLEEVPKVASVETRIVENVRLLMPALPEPAIAQLISIPADREPALNALRMRRGRTVGRDRSLSVVVGEPFADAHGLRVGDPIDAILNGRARTLRVAGIATCPEFVFAIAPGSIIPDDRRFTPIWMVEDAVAPAFRMEGAFNDVLLRLEPGAELEPVLDQVDRILEPYGGRGAYGRKWHPSDAMLEGELDQIRAIVFVLPMIFFGVAAFLLNVVLSRLVLIQRPQIATLKAVGYSNRRIALFYLQLVGVIALLGAVVGMIAGGWLGRELTVLYSEFYRLPLLVSRTDFSTGVQACLAALLAASAGALVAVRGVVRLPPAEAMRPPAPPSYHRTLLERFGLYRILSHAARMVAREIERRPLRTISSSIGLSMAIAILVLGRFAQDALDPIVDLQFGAEQREDVRVDFTHPIPDADLRVIGNVSGIRRVEGLRTAHARLRYQHRYRDTGLEGVPVDGQLRRLHTRDGRHVEVPAEGLLLSRVLADVLEVRPGEFVEVELEEGDRRKRRVRVAGTIDDAFGLHAYLAKPALHRLLGETPRSSTALVSVERSAEQAALDRIRDAPAVAATTRKRTVLERFKAQNQRTVLVVTFILTLFAGAVAVGVVYNNARVALSARARDLASLRVLGFSRREVAAILFGEQAIQVVLATPLGMWLGTLAARAIVDLQADPETWRLPIMISPKTYAFAFVVVAAASALSAWLVRRRLDRLDLVEVLKTRE